VVTLLPYHPQLTTYNSQHLGAITSVEAGAAFVVSLCARAYPDSALVKTSSVIVGGSNRFGMSVDLDQISFDRDRPERTVLMRKHESYAKWGRIPAQANAVCDYVLAHWEKLWF
jgi:hypothetical protein